MPWKPISPSLRQDHSEVSGGPLCDLLAQLSPSPSARDSAASTSPTPKQEDVGDALGDLGGENGAVLLERRNGNGQHRAPQDDSLSWEARCADRPQVLAQLAKDISALVHNARDSSMERRGAAPPPPFRGSSTTVTESSSYASYASSPPSAAATGVRPIAASSFAIPAGSSKVMDSARASSNGLHTSAQLLRREPAAPAAPLFPKEEGLQPPSHSNGNGGGGEAPSPHVRALLSTIETREASLRQKVQILTEEKVSQQRRLEDEVARLQRNNARLEEELRSRGETTSSTPSVTASPGGPPHSSAPRLVIWSEDRECLVQQETRADTTGTPRSSRGTTVPSSPKLTQDSHEELRRQLSEIRGEVSRCAHMLNSQETIPANDVIDIRQQLSALSGEVVQTSRALAANGSVSQARDAEFGDVCRQLEELLSQVSGAMQVAATRPAETSEVYELRAELNILRSEIASTRAHGANAELSDLRSQFEIFRTEVGSRGHVQDWNAATSGQTAEHWPSLRSNSPSNRPESLYSESHFGGRQLLDDRSILTHGVRLELPPRSDAGDLELNRVQPYDVQSPSPSSMPQPHMVRARSNSSLRYSDSGRFCDVMPRQVAADLAHKPVGQWGGWGASTAAPRRLDSREGSPSPGSRPLGQPLGFATDVSHDFRLSSSGSSRTLEVVMNGYENRLPSTPANSVLASNPPATPHSALGTDGMMIDRRSGGTRHRSSFVDMAETQACSRLPPASFSTLEPMYNLALPVNRTSGTRDHHRARDASPPLRGSPPGVYNYQQLPAPGGAASLHNFNNSASSAHCAGAPPEPRGPEPQGALARPMRSKIAMQERMGR